MEGVILEREIIKEPKIPKDANPVFGSPIAPIDRLTIMDDVSFEELVAEWAHGYLKKNEVSVYRLGGSGDKGRDICVEYRDGSTDIYQCKHYDKPLTPSQYVIEFGKLVYYTWVPDGFKVPKNYYIVASKGIGTKLSDLIHDSEELRNYIVEEWDSKCKNTITKNQEITLTGSLLEHLQKFDFSIIKSVSPQDLIEQYRQTPYFKFRFGGGISKRPTITPPTVIPSEVDIPYVKSLMVVYSEILNRPIGTLSNFLEEESKYSKHFMRERKAYYIADSLRRFLEMNTLMIVYSKNLKMKLLMVLWTHSKRIMTISLIVSKKLLKLREASILFLQIFQKYYQVINLELVIFWLRKE